MKNIVIVGGGFGGIKVALDLESKNLSDIRIVLISNKPHFEYQSALYRVIAGSNPLEVCIPLREIFLNKKIEVIEDTIESINTENQLLVGKSESRYKYDYLVLSLGSETEYYNIPGLEKLSFGMKSINEAIVLNRHIHKLFDSCHNLSKEEKECALHFVIVGAGASGVELSAELARYTKIVATNHKNKSVKISIDLVEAGSNILPSMSTNFSNNIKKHLTSLGVNVMINRPIIKEELDRVYLKNANIKTKTVIWTAGVVINHLYTQTKGLKIAKDKKISVDKFLLASGTKNIFIIGDGASSQYSGMAQTAIDQGANVSKNIVRLLNNTTLSPYKAKIPHYAIPVGKYWAGVMIGNIKIYGKLGWIIRRLADLKYFLSILPINKVLIVWRSGKALTNICSICSNEHIIVNN